MQTSTTSRRRLRAALVAAVMGASAFSGAGMAHAEGDPTAWISSDEMTIMSMETCANQSEEYRFRLYYSPDYKGAWVNIGHNIYDMLALKMPYSPARPLYFCPNTGTGSGQVAGNNAASAYNWYEGYIGTVYYSAGYKGAFDMVGARSGHSTLWNTRNDNRSIQFSRPW
ncbi:hypothetical protein [Streptomyces tanashiensis]|uniref:Uncharacterized protein n=1 Tax=Streptomyces tanashiensis TaxID=67367 RepID=A0ABY6QTL1_9ACTN|nr:hypothetical protein [Streptomyces tanashiensis]UZX20539.1 hypothetical protein LDH80_07355 [Streptomyces tanashiensis]GGY46347.1 hypothetical protein GCM10010299_60530 [Streptomyces tanashiensis]